MCSKYLITFDIKMYFIYGVAQMWFGKVENDIAQSQ